MNICLVLHKYGVRLDDACCYPLGFMYVSSFLKNQGHNVKILNYNLWDYDFEKEIENQDEVMFTGFEEFFERIVIDSGICKDKGIKTVIGGALATFKPDIMTKYVDEVFQGEIDITIPIDDILWPDYDGFGIEEYHKRHGYKYMGILASRGCPFRCSFCAHTCNYRERSLDSVWKEIDHYRTKYGNEITVFNDNTLNVNKNRFLAICEGMKSRGKWCAAIRADNFDKDMALAAKSSNCIYFIVGIESFIQEKLDRMNKKIKSAQIVHTLNLLEGYGIDYHGNILFGFENELYDDIMNEWEDMPRGYKVYPAMVQPFIGTTQGRNRGITKNEYETLNEKFIKYVESNGKHMFPTADVRVA
jgi:radical SAM superfamily enzyme YgiQ (UPF0313 family)